MDVPDTIGCCSPYPLGPIAVVATALEYIIPGPLCQLSSAMALYQVSATCLMGTHKYGALAQQYTVLEGGVLHIPGAIFKQERISITPRPNGALSLLFFSLQPAAMRRFLKRSSPGLVPGDLLRKFGISCVPDEVPPLDDYAPNLASDHREAVPPEGF